jgi:hypothetical protein
MKKFTVPCQFGNQTAPFTIYIGEPKRDVHPIQNQATWLSKERGGTVPQKVMDSLSRLRELAEENNISFEDLCVYALTVAEKQEEEEKSGGE